MKTNVLTIKNLRMAMLPAILAFGIVLQSLAAAPQTFKVEKTGKGRPMILIPGFNSAGAVWDETVARYKNQYECHVLTLAGFAGVPAVEKENFLLSVRDEVIAYIKENKLKKPVIVGHSLGGFMALWIGSTAPEITGAAIVVDGMPNFGALMFPGFAPDSLKKAAAYMRKMVASQPEEQFKKQNDMIVRSMVTDEKNVQTVAAWGLNSDRKLGGQVMYEMYTTDIRPELAGMKVPTLVMGAWIGYKAYGQTRAGAEKLYQGQMEKHPGYELKISDNAKHFIMLDDPQWFFAQVDEFLKK